MNITSNRIVQIGNESLLRIDYTGRDGFADWALARLPESGADWVVCIHGHGSNGDQLYVREDIKNIWLPKFLELGLGILTPNLRGNAWMNAQAAQDTTDLLEFVRTDFGAQRFMFASGSMGGTSNLIYASLHPENVSAGVALGAASDLAAYHNWCRCNNHGVICEIADAIEASYGGTPDAARDNYDKHSVLKNAHKLTMPVFITHGSADELIPVAQMRRLCGMLADKPDLVYSEITDGNHDSPLHRTDAFVWAAEKMRQKQ